MSDIPPTQQTEEKISHVTLDQYLKVCGIVGTGGQAKMLIQGGMVRLNGAVETRRRKKLFLGDQVEVSNEWFDDPQTKNTQEPTTATDEAGFAWTKLPDVSNDY